MQYDKIEFSHLLLESVTITEKLGIDRILTKSLRSRLWKRLWVNMSVWFGSVIFYRYNILACNASSCNQAVNLQRKQTFLQHHYTQLNSALRRIRHWAFNKSLIFFTMLDWWQHNNPIRYLIQYSLIQ